MNLPILSFHGYPSLMNSRQPVDPDASGLLGSLLLRGRGGVL